MQIRCVIELDVIIIIITARRTVQLMMLIIIRMKASGASRVVVLNKIASVRVVVCSLFSTIKDPIARQQFNKEKKLEQVS